MGLTKQLKTKWIRALKSGKYKQTTGALKNHEGFCCLGVLCDLINPKGWRGDKDYEFNFNGSRTGFMPVRMGILPKKIQKQLADLNDNGESFEDIAEYIKKNIPTT